MKTDKKILDLINEVRKQKEEIAKIEKPNWITNCSFRWVEGNPKPDLAINLHVESDVRALIHAAAAILSREASYAKATEALGIEAPPFLWDGFSAKDWLNDIKLRIAKIQIATKKKKLEALESRLNAIVSPELRAQMEIEAIEKELT